MSNKPLRFVVLLILLCITWNFSQIAMSQTGQGTFVNPFDGSASYSVTVLPGITLNYSSSLVPTLMTSENRDMQASWMGAGWSLEMGAIEADLKGTTNTDDDEWIYIHLEGAISRIVKDNSGVLRLQDNPYWKIELTKSGDFVTGITVTKDDGSKMKFGDFQLGIGTKQANRCVYAWGGRVVDYLKDTGATQICYRWDLSQTLNPYGIILYDFYYSQEQESLDMGGTSLIYTRASYIDHMVNRRTGQKVVFIRGDRGTLEYQDLTTSSYKIERYEKKFLDSIKVYPTESATQPFQSWDFAYQLVGSGTKTKRLLTSITQLDKSNRPLPSWNFLYDAATYSILSSVQTSSGGATQLTTQQSSVSNLDQSTDAAATRIVAGTSYTDGYQVGASGSTVASYDTAGKTLHIRKWTGEWKVKDFQPDILPRPGDPVTLKVIDNHILLVYKKNTDSKGRVVVYDWREDIQDWQVGFSVAANDIDGSYTKIMANISTAGSHVGIIAGNTGPTYTAQVREWSSVSYSWDTLGSTSISLFPSILLEVADDLMFFDHVGGVSLLQWKKSGGSVTWNGPSLVSSMAATSDHLYTLRRGYIGRFDKPAPPTITIYNLSYNTSTGFQDITIQTLGSFSQTIPPAFADERIVYCDGVTIRIWQRLETAFSAPQTINPAIQVGSGWVSKGAITNDWMFVFNYRTTSQQSPPYDGQIFGYLWDKTSGTYVGAETKSYPLGWLNPNCSIFSSAEILITDNFLVLEAYPTVCSDLGSFTDVYKLDRTDPTSWTANRTRLCQDEWPASKTAIVGANFIGSHSNQTGETKVKLYHDVDKNWSNNISVYRVSKIVVSSSMGDSVKESYTFDANPTFDPSLTFPGHGVMTRSLSPFGSTIVSFNKILAQPRLRGIVDSVRSFKQDGTSLVQRWKPTWSVYQDPSKWYIFQVWKTSETHLEDGISTTTAYVYDSTNGQAKKVSEDVDVKSDLGDLRDRVTEITYAYQQNSAMQGANMLSQVYEVTQNGVRSIILTETEAFAWTDEGITVIDEKQFTVYFDQVVTYTASHTPGYGGVRIGTTYQGTEILGPTCSSCSGSFTALKNVTYYLTAIASATPAHPAASARVHVMYDAATAQQSILISKKRTEYDITTKYPIRNLVWNGSQWITTDSIVSRDSYGNILESTDPNGNTAKTLFGHNKMVPIAEFENTGMGNVNVDNFNDGSVTDNDPFTWTLMSGPWTVTAGVFKSTYSAYAGNHTAQYQNFTADVRLKIVNDYANPSNWAALHFGSTSTDNWNTGYFVYYRSNGEINLHQTGVNLVAVPTGLPATSWRRLSVSVNGTNVQVFVDGQRFINYTLSSAATSGYVKLWTYRTDTEFDDFRCYPVGALAQSYGYDPTTLLQTSISDENNVTSYTSYDGFGRATQGYNDDRKFISEQSYYFSRDGHGGTFVSSDPNFTTSVTYTSPTGHNDLSSSAGWSYAGNTSFNVQFQGEITAQVGKINPSGWGYITKSAGAGDIVSRVDFYVGTAGGTPHVLAFDGPGYRFCVQYDPPTNRFRMQTNFGGGWIYPYTFNIGVTSGKWYTVEIEKGSDGRCYAWVFPKGESRNYADKYTTTGFPATWNPGIWTWSNVDYINVANHYVGTFSQTTTYRDGLGRTLQSQVRDGVNDLVSAVQYDTLGRQYRAWRTYSYNTGHAYDPLYATHATSILNNSNPYTETLFNGDPLSRDSVRNEASRVSSNEDMLFSYGSATLSGTLHQYSQEKHKLSNLASAPWIVTRKYRDKLGRVIQSSTYAEGVAGDTLTNKTTFTFLNQPFVTYAPKGDSTICQYDFLGRMKQKKNPDEGTSKYIYDKAGRLRFMIDSVGLAFTPNKVLYWKYDKVGRDIEKGYITSIAWGDGSTLQNYANTDPTYPATPATWRKKYTYDSNGSSSTNLVGRLYSVLSNNDDDNTTEVEEYFTYDKFGNASKVKQKVIDFSAMTDSTMYYYDLLGRTTKITYPASTYGTLEVNYSFDQVGRVTTVAPTTGAAFATYLFRTQDGIIDSERVNLAGPAIKGRRFLYDERGRLTTIRSDLFREGMTYDNGGYNSNEGFYHGMIASDTSVYPYPGGPSTHTYRFAYDNFGRLTVADNIGLDAMGVGVGAGNATQYDKNSNIFKIRRGTGALLTYNYYFGTNRVQNKDGSGDDYRYDSTGNVTLSPFIPQYIRYDPFTMLTMCEKVNTTDSTNFEYGGAKQRVYKKVTTGASSTSTLYLHGMNDYPLMEKTSAGTERAYVYGPTGLIAFRENSTWYYVWKDHLGSIRLVFNTSGGVQSYYDYDAYGKLGRAQNNTDSKYRYTSQEMESEISTDYYNYRARNYDSDLAMFYASDPAGETFSPYGYVGGNPISFIDPTGARTEIDWGSASYMYQLLAGLASWHAFLYFAGTGAAHNLSEYEDGQGGYLIGNVHIRSDGQREYVTLGYGGYYVTRYVGDQYRNYYDPNIERPGGGRGATVYETIAVYEPVWVPYGANNNGISDVFGSGPSGGGAYFSIAAEFGGFVATGGQGGLGLGLDASGNRIRGVGSASAGGLIKKVDGRREAMNGLYIGLGVGPYLTNATPEQLQGAFDVASLNIGWPSPITFSVQIGSGGNGIWFASFVYGPGIGISVSRYKTHTGVLPTR